MESTDPSMVESLAAIVPDARQILTGQYETPVLRRWYMKAVARYRELYGDDSPAFKEFYALRQDFLRGTVSPATIKAKVSEFLSLAESLIEGAATHVPYKGIAPVLIDVLGDRVAGTFADMPAVLSYIKSGKMKALGLVGTKRNSAAPDIPTIYEQGFPGVDALSWYGVLAPTKTPPAVIARIAEGLARALADPDLKEKLAASGVESALSTPEEFKRLIQNDRTRLAKIIVERKIVAE